MQADLDARLNARQRLKVARPEFRQRHHA